MVPLFMVGQSLTLICQKDMKEKTIKLYSDKILTLTEL